MFEPGVSFLRVHYDFRMLFSVGVEFPLGRRAHRGECGGAVSVAGCEEILAVRRADNDLNIRADVVVHFAVPKRITHVYPGGHAVHEPTDERIFSPCTFHSST